MSKTGNAGSLFCRYIFLIAKASLMCADEFYSAQKNKILSYYEDQNYRDATPLGTVELNDARRVEFMVSSPDVELSAFGFEVLDFQSEWPPHLSY